MQRLLTLLALGLLGCAPTSNGTCTDGTRNGEESDVDCGGPACSPCELTLACLTHSDCTSVVCARRVCVSPSCLDGTRNGEETDVDCGATCAPCSENRACVSGPDCESAVCIGQRCAAPSCSDLQRNGRETDLDCGGDCAPCPLGAGCGRNADCADGACRDAQCVERCAVPLLACGNTCVDPRVDPENCGGCGLVCPPGGLCDQSSCQGLSCPSGTHACGPACVGDDDVLNCGACGNVCNPGEACVANQCRLNCSAGQTACGGQCVRTATDPGHCGGCGQPCQGGEVCASGLCVPSACAPPLALCALGTICVDPRFDPDNCGGCGVVCPAVPQATRVCDDQICSRTACNPGFADCNGALADGCEAQLVNDPMNCGMCGRVCLGGPCANNNCS
ncbi:MAG: hypothetical protein Q8K32_20270 [Archangium sp.]|nr:hypothetical protein [Archangium sp.]